MSLGPVMIDIGGIELTQEDSERLKHPLVGGIILFTRNYESREQLQALTTKIHELRKPPLLIATDQEGGRVQRFREEFTELPTARLFGEVFNENPKRAKRLAETSGWLMASELRSAGVDFSFAPVLDIDFGISEIIGSRAFHSDPETVADLAHAFMMGMHHAGMAATGKHFPGHGGVAPDSHLALPEDRRDFDAIAGEDLIAFERMIHYGLEGIMPAHISYPLIDEQPAGFSKVWIQDILRKQLGFQGVVFSDDLSMKGAHGIGDSVARAEAALAAGCDMALVCNDEVSANEILDGLKWEIDPASLLRLAHMHGRTAETRKKLEANEHYHQSVEMIQHLA